MASIIYNNIPFNPDDLSNIENNFALGQFLTAWSQTESICGFLFRELSQISYAIANTIFDRIGVREQIEILTELVATIPDAERNERALMALKEVEELSKVRNKIVHAGWGQFNGEAARFWHGITSSRLSEISQESPKGKADRIRFIFTISEIAALTTRNANVRSKLEILLNEIINERLQSFRAQEIDR